MAKEMYITKDDRTVIPIKARPIFSTFVTDIFGHLNQRQEIDECARFEVRMADCFEAYGYPKNEEKCKAYLRDYNECIGYGRQYRRVLLMRRERERQWRAGELKTHYEKLPPLHSY